MNYKKIIANLTIIFLLISIFFLYYKSKEKQQKTFKILKVPETSLTNKNNIHKIENFTYTHYKKNKKLFTLSAKFHTMLENQRSNMEFINIIIYDEEGNKSYEINAGKGFITKDKDLVVLWKNVEINNVKGWKIKTNQLKYLPNDEVLEIPIKSNFSWQQKNIKGKAQSLKYYPKRKELELFDSVSLVQKKDDNTIEIIGSHLILNEQNDSGVLEGEPARIKNNQNKIFGNKILFSFYPDEKTIKSADIYENAFLIYSSEQPPEQGAANERNIKAFGNTMKMQFDEKGKINSWSIFGNAEVKATEVKNNKPLKYILDSPHIEGKYKEAAILSEIVSPEPAVLIIRDFSLKPPRIITTKSNEVSIFLNNDQSPSINSVSFNGNVEIIEGENKGLSNSASFYLNENRLILNENCNWINPDLKIKADKFDIFLDEKKIKAENKSEKPIETLLQSNKFSFSKNDENSYIYSKDLLIVGEKIKFNNGVFFSNNTYTLFSDYMEADKEKEEIIANKLKELKIKKNISKENKNAFYAIKAEKMIFQKKENKFNFNEKSEFKDSSEGVRIIADKIYLQTNQADEITKALAEGNVSIFKEKISGKSGKAEYKINENLILLMERAELMDGEKNQLKGEFLTLNMKDDRIKAIGKGYQRTESLYYQKKKE